MKLALAVAGLCLALTSAPLDAQMSDTEKLELSKAYLAEFGVDALVELQVKELQRSLPIKSNELEQITGVTYIKSLRTEIFRHGTSPGWREQAAKIGKTSVKQATDDMPGLLQLHTVNGACSVAFTKLLLEHGLTIKHNYYESDGSFLFGTKVDIDDCS